MLHRGCEPIIIGKFGDFQELTFFFFSKFLELELGFFWFWNEQSCLDDRAFCYRLSCSNMASKPEGQEVRLRNRVRGFLDQVQDSTGKRIQKACADLASEFPNAHLAKVRRHFSFTILPSSARMADETQKINPEVTPSKRHFSSLLSCR